VSNRPGNLARDVPKFLRAAPKGTWVDLAACAGMDTDLWFLDNQTGSYRQVRAICNTCPVQPDCLAYALENRISHGMWGGLNPIQRRQLRRVSA